MTEYTILTEATASDLIVQVNAQCRDGWEPLGGVQVLHYTTLDERHDYQETHKQYYQALIRRKTEDTL